MVGNTIRKVGDIGGKVLRVAAPLAQPVAHVASNIIDALPVGVAGVVAKNVIQKTADWISSGRGAEMAGKVSGYGRKIQEMSEDG